MSRLIDLALRTWPAECRDSRGDELVDTAAALAADRSTAREALSLGLAGFAARYRAATGASPMRTWTAAARIALFVTITLVIAEVLHLWWRGPGGSFTRSDLNEMVASGLVIAGGCGVLMCVLPARVMAVVGTAAATLSLYWGPPTATWALRGLVAGHVLLLLFLAWRNERPIGWRGLWFPVAAITLSAVTLAVGSFWYLTDSLLIWVTILAAVIARWDPRLLAGLCLHWATRAAMWIPGFLAGEMHRTNVWKWYALVAVVAGLCTLRAHRSIARARVT